VQPLDDAAHSRQGKRPKGVTATGLDSAIIGKKSASRGNGQSREYGGEAIRVLRWMAA